MGDQVFRPPRRGRHQPRGRRQLAPGIAEPAT